MYTIEDIENAIIGALDGLKTSLGVRTIKSYQGELEGAKDLEEFIARVVINFPAIYVIYGGSEYEEHGPRKIEKITYVVMVCDRSLRGEEEARRGGAGNPGTYAMLNAIRDLLYGQRLSLDIFPMTLLREDGVWFGKGASVYAAEYECAQAHLYTGDE